MFQSSLPKITRATDAVRINEILNHQSVRPLVSDTAGAIDLSAVAGNPDIFILLGDHGGFVLTRLMSGVFEAHTQILPEGRGEWALSFVQAGLRWMFTRTEAYDILTRVPDGHLSAKALAVKTGFRYEFTSDHPYQFNGRTVSSDVYSIRLQDWAATAPELVEAGEWLHQRFAKEGDRLGLIDGSHGAAQAAGVRWQPMHDDMPSHNRYVGLTYHMGIGGNLARGVMMYNRWALISHRPAHLLARIVSENTVWFDHTTVELLPDGDIRMSLQIEKRAA